MNNTDAVLLPPATLTTPAYDLNHPLRVMLANEVHSRPFVDISAPAEISHLVVCSDAVTGHSQASMAERVSRASDMLRTRVSIAQEQQNSAILASLNHRAEVQLRLQQAVEAFSTVAITSYLVGLIGYVTKGLESLGVGVNPDLASLLSLPLVFAAAWIVVKRFRDSLAKREI